MLGEDQIQRTAAPVAHAGVARGVTAALVAGCFWGSTGVFVRVLDVRDYGPLTIVFVRMSIAFVITVAILFAMRRKDLFRIRLGDFWCFVGTGVSSGILLNLFYSASTVMNSLSLAAVLLATAPIFVVLLAAPIFGERITPTKTQSLVVAVVGCALTSGIVGSGTVFSPRGVAIGLLSGLGYALYSIMSRFALDRGYDSRTINLYSFGIGAAVCVPFTDFPVVGRTVADAPVKMTLILIAHALFTSLLPYILFTYSMSVVDTGKASILASSEPVAATVFGIVLYHEIPDAVRILGIALVLFALALLNVKGGLGAMLARPRARLRGRG